MQIILSIIYGISLPVLISYFVLSLFYYANESRKFSYFAAPIITFALFFFVYFIASYIVQDMMGPFDFLIGVPIGFVTAIISPIIFIKWNKKFSNLGSYNGNKYIVKILDIALLLILIIFTLFLIGMLQLFLHPPSY